MLLSPSSSPRRLALLALFLFLAVLILLRQSHYTQNLSIPHRPIGVPTQEAVDDVSEVIHSHKDANTLPDENESAQPESETKPPSTHKTLPYKPKPIPNYRAGKITKVKRLPFQKLQQKIKALIDWKTLDSDYHWPSWDAYKDADYDPNRWEGFEWESGYFTENGVKRIGLRPEPYLPYPDYNTDIWKQQWKGEYVACEGARGNNLNESIEDIVMAYRGIPPDFPSVTIGTADVVGLDDDVCFDRYHRYGPYGFDQSTQKSIEGWSRPTVRPEWSTIWWGQLQDACLQRNKERYPPTQRAPMSLVPDKELPEGHDMTILESDPDSESSGSWMDSKAVTQRYHSRTALLIRTWEGYTYTENDLQAIRALVTELSLLTGGEYQVFLFVNVKEENADIYTDPQVYQDVLRRVVPRELRDISLLWTEKVCEAWYPKVGNWQVYWQQFMPLQWFSKTHPEFDYIWNWETDARYTGNHFHFLEKVVEFARNMPRKNLWERNSRFYFPDAHGNYASFLADTDQAIREATEKETMVPVWGPQPYDVNQMTIGPKPPRSYEEDAYKWGTGEEADLITLQPIWDPGHTEWSYRYKIWNYVEGKVPHFSNEDPGDDSFYHPDFAKIPRRVFINTVARFSKKMLHAMHLENLAGRSMQAEMWPATVALQHGLKAVYAPHPIWADRKWPAWYLDATFNADNGETAAWGQRKDSPYNHDREAAFRGWSWYYSTGFPRILYRRFLGWSAQDILGDFGGEDYENHRTTIDGVGEVGGRGRMCLPGMLLHPVKKVKEDDTRWVDIRSPDPEDVAKEKMITEEIQELLSRLPD